MLTGAVKLLRGGVFFREVDAFPLPGAWYLLAGVMALFGQSLVVARVLDAAIYTAMVVVSYVLARKVLGRGAAAFYGMSLVALKYWAWPIWTAYVYPDLAIALTMGGILALVRLLEGREHWPAFVAGLLFAAATSCKQTVGIYPGLVGLGMLGAWRILAIHGAPAWSSALVGSGTAAPRPLRPLWLYAAGGAVGLATPFFYFAAHGLGTAMVVNGLVRPFVGYLPLSGLPYSKMLNLCEFGKLDPAALFPYFPGMSWFLLHFHFTADQVWPRVPSEVVEAVVRTIYVLIPLAFAVAAALLGHDLHMRRQRTVATAKALAFCLLTGATLLSAFPRADYPHLINVAPTWLAAIFLAADLFMRREGAGPWRRRLVSGAMALGLTVAVIGGVLMLMLMHRACSSPIWLPHMGRRWVVPRQEQLVTIVNFVRSHTKPGDPLFVLGHEAYFYFLCDRYSPWPFAQPFPGQTGAVSGRELADLIERHRVRYIIKGNTALPGLPPIAAYAPLLIRYIERHYREVDLKAGSGDNYCGAVLERVE